MQLETLLAKIVQATSTVINADRTSLFLHDDRTGELWSVVAEGVRERQIRFPADRGSPARCSRRAMRSTCRTPTPIRASTRTSTL
jgi:hypothetical protein